MLWHKRLGHISKERMERLIKENILHNLDFFDCEVYADYVKGKLTTGVRKKKVARSIGVLQLIHTVTYGPIIAIALGGFKYFITFIYNSSRYGWIDLLQEKFESLDALKAFKATAKMKFGMQIKCVRSNRGDEFYGKYNEIGRNPRPFFRFLQDCDIEAQYTMSGTPQQNGVIEG